jgi:hypothetical protein
VTTVGEKAKKCAMVKHRNFVPVSVRGPTTNQKIRYAGTALYRRVTGRRGRSLTPSSAFAGLRAGLPTGAPSPNVGSL